MTTALATGGCLMKLVVNDPHFTVHVSPDSGRSAKGLRVVGLDDRPTVCRLRVWREPTARGIVAIVTERADNPGRPIPSVAEELAAAIVERCGLPSYPSYWIRNAFYVEHRRHRTAHGPLDKYSTVEFQGRRDSTIGLFARVWTEISRDALEQLIDGPLDEKDAPYSFATPGIPGPGTMDRGA